MDANILVEMATLAGLRGVAATDVAPEIRSEAGYRAMILSRSDPRAVCSWCGRDYASTAAAEDSHGICPSCAPVVLTSIERES